ncbi:type II toxin-antitoxin system VapC family toxin [Streptomyces sp. ME02-8801-2C]|uniref:type II toxin-antitoxin system VapC family toxin n=1 Tax=Streptomyces sp. ME02-8801-2C TaxID=3028680 RepID=UPI0029A419B5|nr:type II toxin-antitoxin system VapC family toxin [Streptomyces sp. ME02-8801-2C]MDX3455691.1 type II toxin-antitoxin system VapC family toxin [Streptomyces sp. ME02-8801-2C]
MLQPVILDTDVASRLHKGTLTEPLGARLIGRRPLITFVTYGELTKWTEVRDWGGRRRQELADWLVGIPVLLGDEAVAVTWGRLAAAGHKAGRPQPNNDMWIAAACLTHDLPLATLNLKDYRYFQEKHGLRVLGEE